jgi:putative ATPase
VGQRGLFDGAEKEAARAGSPLAARMRPRTFEEFLGEDRIAGENSNLRRSVRAGLPGSLILWGPPGSGKTTLAMLIAGEAGAPFIQLSAVESGVAAVRRAVADSRASRDATGRAAILFIDEIHRFNRTQQDSLLPHVEDGTVTLIGATTENPSFSVTSPLLSRCRVIVLQRLTDQQLSVIIERALSDAARGLHGRVSLDGDALAALIRLASGDARVALTTLEAAANVAPDGARLTRADVEAAAQRALAHDASGDLHFWAISAYIKSLRDSDADGALYWLARLLEAGEDPLFVARRLVIAAAEDVGLADPRALVLSQAAQSATAMIGMPECVYPLAEATSYVALAPKSNATARAYWAAAADVREHGALPVPLHLRNAVTGLDRHHGFGREYVYAHDDPEGAARQEHLPPELHGHRYLDLRNGRDIQRG